MIKNNKGQYYAVECDSLEQVNIFFTKINKMTSFNYWKYVTTDNNLFGSTIHLDNYEIIHFNDWIKLTQQPETITLPIEDYNRLRKLEIKSEIKRLKKELKGL